MLQGRVTETVEIIKQFNRGDYQPKKGGSAEDPERNNDREWSIMIVTCHQGAGSLNSEPARGGLLGHVQVVRIQGIPFAFEQILGHLWQDLFPHFHPPLRGN